MHGNSSGRSKYLCASTKLIGLMSTIVNLFPRRDSRVARVPPPQPRTRICSERDRSSSMSLTYVKTLRHLSPRNHDATSFTLLAASFETRSLHRPDCRNEDCLRTRQYNQCQRQRRRRPDCYAHPNRPTKDCLCIHCHWHQQIADNDDSHPCRSVAGVNC